MKHIRCFFLVLPMVWLAVVGQALGATLYDQAVSEALRELGTQIPYCPKVKAAPELMQKTWPNTLAVRKVVPREFSPESINALLKMTGLSTNETYEGADGGVFSTPGLKRYGNLKRGQWLQIIPAQGWLIYEDSNASEDPLVVKNGVKKVDRTGIAPGEKEVYRRGLEIAKLLGLTEADLAKMPETNRLDYRYSKSDRYTSETNRTVVQRVFFRRAVDNYPILTGHYYGGIWVGFGINSVLHDIELTVRASKPDLTITVAPSAEQLKIFSNLKQVCTIGNNVDWDAVKKDKNAVLELSLVEIMYFENDPTKFQKIMPPMLRWEGEVKWKDKTEPIFLFTPVVGKYSPPSTP